MSTPNCPKCNAVPKVVIIFGMSHFHCCNQGPRLTKMKWDWWCEINDTEAQLSEFCVNLVNLREGKGYSQKTLAGLICIDQSNISAYECGKTVPGLDMVIKLVNVFECSFEELLGCN